MSSKNHACGGLRMASVQFGGKHPWCFSNKGLSKKKHLALDTRFDAWHMATKHIRIWIPSLKGNILEAKQIWRSFKSLILQTSSIDPYTVNLSLSLSLFHCSKYHKLLQLQLRQSPNILEMTQHLWLDNHLLKSSSDPPSSSVLPLTWAFQKTTERYLKVTKSSWPSF